MMFEHACKIGLEGVISKRIDAPYRPGRGESWIKVKCITRGGRGRHAGRHQPSRRPSFGAQGRPRALMRRQGRDRLEHGAERCGSCLRQSRSIVRSSPCRVAS